MMLLQIKNLEKLSEYQMGRIKEKIHKLNFLDLTGLISD